MTPFSTNQEQVEELIPVSVLIDKQANGFAIEAIVFEDRIGYLQATTQWLEENSIPEGNFNRYIPSTIIDKIKSEAIEEHLFRPSVVRTQRTSTLDFLL